MTDPTPREATTSAVPCDGCGHPTPYELGDREGTGSFGEHLSTPLGRCFRRTHWDRGCVRRSRAAVNGRPVKLAPSDEERRRAQLGVGA